MTNLYSCGVIMTRTRTEADGLHNDIHMVTGSALALSEAEARGLFVTRAIDAAPGFAIVLVQVEMIPMETVKAVANQS